MSFLFASSHLPELEHPADEEDDDVQPMPRSGMVRAFSHLPQPVRRDPAGPLSQRGAQPIGRQLQPVGSEGLSTPHADGVAAAKASGVFDAVRQHYNQGGTPHIMDEDGNLRPRTQSRPQPSAPAALRARAHRPPLLGHRARIPFRPRAR